MKPNLDYLFEDSTVSATMSKTPQRIVDFNHNVNKLVIIFNIEDKRMISCLARQVDSGIENGR